MNEKQKSPSWGLEPELVHEMSETVSTLKRLGLTLANLPITLLPDQDRARVQRFADDIYRIGGTLPRTLGAMFEEVTEELELGDRSREDLGTRLRRERRRLAEEEQQKQQAELESEA